ncbi:MAG TPA: hypothetical protein VFA65_07565 [Bryobacteraceae bacterium]|nr:hypothetical protein [Bryobacteraceae bacterium]
MVTQLQSSLRWNKEKELLSVEKNEKEIERSSAAAQDYSPRQYSFRASAILMVKLLAIGGLFLAVLAALDILLVP